jgi:hypothetical protein
MRRPVQLLAAAAASLALVSTPVMARDHWGRGRGWDRHHHRDNGVGAGEVIAGVAVLGAIAAIAGVFDGGRDRENEPVPVPYPDAGPGYRGVPGDYGAPAGGYGVPAGGSGLDRAVDICVGEIEATGTGITGVDGANRTGDGWFVSGTVDSGAPFSCRIDNDGRVGNVEIGDTGIGADGQGFDDGGYYGAAAPVDDNQYDDATYIRARNDLEGGRSYSAR